MSSGVEADIALDAAVIASLGLIRVLGGAAGLAAAGAGALAAFAEGRAEIQAQRADEARRLEKAIGEVLDRNARIAALAGSARRHSVSIELPPPMEVAGRFIDDLTGWVTRVDVELAGAEATLAAAITDAAIGPIFATTAESLKARPNPLTDASRSDVAKDLPRILARLLPDAADDDRRSVTDAAKLALTASTSAEAESRLTEVRIRLQKANERTKAIRADRAAAARFVRELTGHTAAEATVQRLRKVLDEDQVFDEELRAEALRLVSEVRREAERRYVAAALRDAFGGLGYEVSEGFETLTARDGEAVLTRGDWPQHAVKIRVEDARQVRMALLRTEPAEGDEQRRLDVEREEQWCASFAEARERLAEAGINTDVRWRVEPGEQRIPVIRREAVRQRPRARERELDR